MILYVYPLHHTLRPHYASWRTEARKLFLLPVFVMFILKRLPPLCTFMVPPFFGFGFGSNPYIGTQLTLSLQSDDLMI